MPRTVAPLTAAKVKKLPPGRHAVGGPVPGLVVIVSAGGERRWVLRRWVDGTQREFEVGGAGLSLDDARTAAAVVAESLRERQDAARHQGRRQAGATDNPFLGEIGRELRNGLA